MTALFILVPLIGLIFMNQLFKDTTRQKMIWMGMLILAWQMVQVIIGVGNPGNAFARMPVVKYLSDILTVDFLSSVALFTIALIALVALFVEKYAGQGDHFNFTNLVMLIVIGMNGVVMVDDLFSLYVFLEIVAVSSFVLIAIDRRRDALEGAFKYFVLSAIATLLILSALALLFMESKSLVFYDVKAYLVVSKSAYPITFIVAFMLFFTGLAIKSGLVPFHGWVPDAYTSASSSVSVLLAGIVTKVAGVYIVMRMVRDVFVNILSIQHLLMGLGILSIFIGALAAIGQTDFKRMLAYSSISQVGYIILGAAVGTNLGFIGAILHFFNHATFKSLLFVNSTAVESQTGTRDLNKLGGLASKMRITGGSSAIAFLSTAGIPPLSGFWSKLMIVLALWMAQYREMAILAILGSVITLAYFLVLQRKVFFGKLAEGLENVREANLGITIPSLVLSGIIILVGVLFPLIWAYLKSKALL
ncbi:MAG: complex I subunit 5 family protein [Candidatus Omnitrophota bacterium]